MQSHFTICPKERRHYSRRRVSHHPYHGTVNDEIGATKTEQHQCDGRKSSTPVHLVGIIGASFVKDGIGHNRHREDAQRQRVGKPRTVADRFCLLPSLYHNATHIANHEDSNGAYWLSNLIDVGLEAWPGEQICARRRVPHVGVHPGPSAA